MYLQQFGLEVAMYLQQFGLEVAMFTPLYSLWVAPPAKLAGFCLATCHLSADQSTELHVVVCVSHAPVAGV